MECPPGVHFPFFLGVGVLGEAPDEYLFALKGGQLFYLEPPPLGRTSPRPTRKRLFEKSYYGGPWLIGSLVYINTYIFHPFYYQYLVLLTTASRNRKRKTGRTVVPEPATSSYRDNTSDIVKRCDGGL